MSWLQMTEEEILNIVSPIMDNLMQASTDIDHEKHVKDFSKRMKEIVTKENLEKQCREYQEELGTHFVAGAGARFAFLTLPVEYPRWFVYGRAGVGYAVWFPSQLAQDSFGSIHVEGSLGVEYYTKLRHLSIGLEAAFQSLLLPFAFGVQVYPTVKYTF